MPLYEYQCDACGHRFEVIHQKFSDKPIETCPKCGGVVHKLMSSPAIQFKGTGWYITDYARKSGDSKDGKERQDAKSSGEGKDTKESKEGKDSKETKETKDTKESKESKSESAAK